MIRFQHSAVKHRSFAVNPGFCRDGASGMLGTDCAVRHPMPALHPMANANAFKLGLFSVNAEGGTAFTKVPNRWRADWSAI